MATLAWPKFLTRHVADTGWADYQKHFEVAEHVVAAVARQIPSDTWALVGKRIFDIEVSRGEAAISKLRTWEEAPGGYAKPLPPNQPYSEQVKRVFGYDPHKPVGPQGATHSLANDFVKLAKYLRGRWLYLTPAKKSKTIDQSQTGYTFDQIEEIWARRVAYLLFCDAHLVFPWRLDTFGPVVLDKLLGLNIGKCAEVPLPGGYSYPYYANCGVPFADRFGCDAINFLFYEVDPGFDVSFPGEKPQPGSVQQPALVKSYAAAASQTGPKSLPGEPFAESSTKVYRSYPIVDDNPADYFELIGNLLDTFPSTLGGTPRDAIGGLIELLLSRGYTHTGGGSGFELSASGIAEWAAGAGWYEPGPAPYQDPLYDHERTKAWLGWLKTAGKDIAGMRAANGSEPIRFRRAWVLPIGIGACFVAAGLLVSMARAACLCGTTFTTSGGKYKFSQNGQRLTPHQGVLFHGWSLDCGWCHTDTITTPDAAGVYFDRFLRRADAMEPLASITASRLLDRYDNGCAPGGGSWLEQLLGASGTSLPKVVLGALAYYAGPEVAALRPATRGQFAVRANRLKSLLRNVTPANATPWLPPKYNELMTACVLSMHSQAALQQSLAALAAHFGAVAAATVADGKLKLELLARGIARAPEAETHGILTAQFTDLWTGKLLVSVAKKNVPLVSGLHSPLSLAAQQAAYAWQSNKSGKTSPSLAMIALGLEAARLLSVWTTEQVAEGTVGLWNEPQHVGIGALLATRLLFRTNASLPNAKWAWTGPLDVGMLRWAGLVGSEDDPQLDLSDRTFLAVELRMGMAIDKLAVGKSTGAGTQSFYFEEPRADLMTPAAYLAAPDGKGSFSGYVFGPRAAAAVADLQSQAGPLWNAAVSSDSFVDFWAKKGVAPNAWRPPLGDP